MPPFDMETCSFDDNDSALNYMRPPGILALVTQLYAMAR